MSAPKKRPPLPARIQLYVLVVACLGAIAITLSAVDLLQPNAARPDGWHWHWLKLAGLTLVSGWLSVKLPSSFNGTISISETFVFTGTVLYGPAVGTVLVLLDGLVLCIKEQWRWRRLRWQQVVFNLTASPMSIWIGARVAGINNPIETASLSLPLVLKLAAFAAVYFLLNSWLVTFAVALQQRVKPFKIWWTNFRELSINYAAAASAAAFLVNTPEKNRADVGVMVVFPLLLVIYLTYRWSTKRIEHEREKTQELNRVFLSTIEALAFAIDAKDQVTHGHIRRVQRYTMALAEALGVKEEKQLDALRAAALLHDTGKLAVPEYILNKPGPLTASEFERMKVHADVGADILKSINFPYPVEPIVRHHHESWDGSGYPTGLKGQEIPLGARILSVVDCYDALTSDRPYRPRYTRQQAEQVLRDRRGTMYDPWVVDGLLTMLDELERADSADQEATRPVGSSPQSLIPAQLEAISATTAEEREFNELRRDLPKATTVVGAANVLFGHLKRVVPAASLALFIPRKDTADLDVVACTGVGVSAIDGLKIQVGDRISGWAFAHKEAVVNSDATLELGPVARTLSVPLRYAIAVPVIYRDPIGVVTLYSREPFGKDHQRLVEGASTLFAETLAALAVSSSSTKAGEKKHEDDSAPDRESAGAPPESLPERLKGRIH